MAVYNVVSYGADPTGASDSTSAIQSAMSAVPAEGGEVYFPAGLYKISASIGLPWAPVTIRGEAMDAVEIWQTAQDDVFYAPFGYFYMALPTIRDLTFSTDIANTHTAIRLDYPNAGSVNECTGLIQRVTIRPKGHTVSGHAFKYGIDLNDCWNFHVRDCFIHGANDDYTKMTQAIHLGSKSLDVVISGVKIFGAQYGIVSDGACEGGQFSDLTILGCDYGVYFNNSEQHPWGVVANSHICAKVCGIKAVNRAQLTIDGNLIYKDGGSDQEFNGIHLSTNSGGATVLGNKIVKQSGATGTTRGILIDGSAEVITVLGNSSVDCDYTVVISSGSQKCTVVGNTRSGGTATVSDSGTSDTVGNNNG